MEEPRERTWCSFRREELRATSSKTYHGSSKTLVSLRSPHTTTGMDQKEGICNSDPRSIHSLLWTTSGSEFNTKRCIQLKLKPRKRRKAKSDLGIAQHMRMCLHALHPAASTAKLSSVTFSSRLEGTTTSLYLLPSINARGPSLSTCSDHTFSPPHPQQPPLLKWVLFFPRPSAFLSVAAATERKRESHPLPTLHSMNGLGKTPEAVQG